MKGFKEFRARLESDAEFVSKFKGLKDDSQIIALAKAEGYDLSASSFEQLSEEELDNVAGGGGWFTAHWGK